MTTKPETVIKQIEELPKIQRLPLLQFKDWLIEEEDSSMTNVGNYLRVLKLFSIELGNKEFKNISREDVLDFLNRRKKSIDVDPDKKWVRTWNDYFARLIGFYRWLYNNEITLDREDWNTPEPFNTIKKKKNKRDSSYSPNDVWEIGDLLLAIKYCDNIRDKAVFTIGWDMVSRNHELVKVKIKDIIIKEKYAEISTAWDTKTGIRTCPIIVGFPYLRELLNAHPFATNPNSFLILSRTTSKPLNPDSLWRIADTLKKRITKMIKDEEIKGEDKDQLVKLLQKPWNPYLMTRHSSLTEKSDILNDFQLKQYAGWGINSTRPRTYVHRRGKQIINPLLQEHGIIEKHQPRAVRQECSKCGHINTTEATLCSKCSFVLNTRAWEQVRLEEVQEKKDLNLTISALKQKIEILEQKQSEGQSKKDTEEQRQKMEEMDFKLLQLQQEVGILRKGAKSDDKALRAANTILYKNQKKIPGLSMKRGNPKYFVKDKDIEKNYNKIYDIDSYAFDREDKLDKIENKSE